jgi:hypothetical protein
MSDEPSTDETVGLADKIRQFATNGLTRRTFLVAGGTAAAGAAVNNAFGRGAENAADASPQDVLVTGSPDFIATLRRPEDQCLLTLAFYNLAPNYSVSPPAITVIDSNAQSYLAVAFGAQDASAPQHVAEEAFPLDTGSLPSQTKAPTPKPTTSSVKVPPVNARVAGTSRLVFQVPNSAVAPAGSNPLELTADSLLHWVTLRLSVVPNALPPVTLGQLFTTPPAGASAPVKPTATQTSIELPYGLVLSPPVSPAYAQIVDQFAPTTVFTNATQPVTHGTWTELWHTRLAARVLTFSGELGTMLVNETNRDLRSVRAVWCTDSRFATDVQNEAVEPNPDPKLPPFTTSLAYADRYDIVRLSSDFSQGKGPYLRAGVTDANKTVSPFVPQPAKVDNLMLSSLGGWLDCNAHWNLPHSTQTGAYNSSLLSWRHRAVQGRDSYVRVVRKGYLFPWGHRASLVTVTERQPTYDGSQVGAYLRQKTFIVVTDPVKTYGAAGDFAPDEGRYLPFTGVEMLTLVTPDLAAPKAFVGTNNERVFEPKIGTSPFLFHLRGTDWAGDPIDFRSPVLWVDDTYAYADTATTTSFMASVFAAWKKSSSGTYPSISMHSQRVSVAEPKDPSAAAGDTQLVLSSVALSVVHPKSGTTAQNLVDASQPAFYPALHTLTVKLPQAATLSGHAVADTVMVYDSHYLTDGFTNNKGGIFLRRSGSTRNPIKFSAKNSGGSFTPDLTVDGYSREIGPASGNVDDLRAGVFDPAQVFTSVDAKLLGGLKLSSILQTVQFGDSDNGQALSLVSVERHNPHRIMTYLDWHPSIQSGGPTGTTDLFNPTGDVDNSMDLHALIVTDLDNPSNSRTTIVGQLRDFDLNLFGTGASYFIKVPFDSLTFRSVTGKKTDVDVAVSATQVQFEGALSFVQDLATYLNFGGSGLTIDTSGSAITATLTLAIPSIGIGVFALENIAFSAGVAIPYNGDPVRFDFAFCSEENPFQLEIMIFSGGGFIGLGVGVDGVELLAFGFDFGFGLSIDVGIASGQVSLTGGVSYEAEQLPSGGQDVTLTAYVKASGGISALGLVSVSVEMCLSLTYESDGTSSQLAGDAEMSISVHIIFFGFTVGFSVHEEFAGSGPSSFASNTPGGERFSAFALTGTTVDVPPWVTNPKPNSFGTSMTQADWDRYCTSFALLGV